MPFMSLRSGRSSRSGRSAGLSMSSPRRSATSRFPTSRTAAVTPASATARPGEAGNASEARPPATAPGTFGSSSLRSRGCSLLAWQVRIPVTPADFIKLDRRESFRLLASLPVGRLILTVGALLTVRPLKFVVIDELIVLRTAAHTSVCRHFDRTIVAFEVDELDTTTGKFVTISTELVEGRRIARSPI